MKLKLKATLSAKLITTSAGVIITDGAKVLLGHATNGKNWDIPKGGVDPDETPLQAAIRELAEETGLTAPEQVLVDLGAFDYKNTKRLHLFLWHVQTLPDPKTCKCHSTFIGGGGVERPELDAFALVAWENLSKFVNQKLIKVLESLEPRIKDLIKNNS